MKWIFGVTLALIAFAVPGNAQGKTVPVLDKLLAGFVEAFNRRDAATLASFYAEDGVLMAPDMPMIRGRANIEAAVNKMFERGGVLKLAATVSEISGSQAFAAGTFTVTISGGTSLTLTGVGGAGGSLTFAAKFLTVFKRVGSDWKIAFDMQNADQPPPK